MGEAPANSLKGEKEFSYEGVTYRAVLDWEAIVSFEAATKTSFAEFLAVSAAASFGGPIPLMSHIGAFMRAILQRHHPNMTAERGCEIYLDETVKRSINEALGNALPDAKETTASPGEPHAARSGGSRKTSASGSKRAAKSGTSGARRRA